jgi:hypothetical protein
MYPGQILEIYLDEIKRLYLNGLSAGDIFAEVKEGSISSVKKALESMKNGSAPVKITEAEEATRIAPSRTFKNQEAERTYTKLKENYSQELLDKTDEFTKNPKYKTLNQVEKDLFKHFNKSKYTLVPFNTRSKNAFFRPADKMFNIPQAFEIYGGEFGKRKGREKETALRQIIGTKFLENNNKNYKPIKEAMTLFYTIPETKREDLDDGIKNKIRKFNKDFSISRAATRGGQSGIVNRFFEDFDFSKRIKDWKKIWTTKEGLQDLINNPTTSTTDVNMYKKELKALTSVSDNVLNRLKTTAPELFKVGAPAGVMQLEHRVARALGQTGDLKLPKNYIARASYVPGYFNKAKYDTYDKPLMDLISEYNSGDKSAKSKILSLTKDFNKRSKGFLNNVNFEFGKKVKMIDNTPKFSELTQLDVVKDVKKGVESGKAFFESFGSDKVGTLTGKASDYITPNKDISVLKKIMVNAAKTNEGGVCQIFRAKGGRIGFAAGSNCVTQMENAVDNDPVKLSQDINKLPEQSGAINKFKSAASTFLNVAKKGGRFGALAAVGAATAGLVKQFRNDDPSTYLSSENQQKNMLIDMLEQPIVTPTETPSTALGDATLPAIGAVTAAGMIPGGAELYRQRTGAGSRKRPLGGDRLDAEGVKIPKKRVSPFRAATGPLSGVLGKGLAATGTPLGMLALEPLYIGQQIAEGDSFGEIATNPINYLGPAFAGSLSKEATRFAGPKMANLMRLGISPTTLKTVSRRFGLPGLALSAGVSGYEMYQNKKAGRGLFDDG